MTKPDYFSFLICKHGDKHFLYVNGLPIGYVEREVFTPDTQAEVPATGKMPPQIRFIGTGQSIATVIVMLDAIAEALQNWDPRGLPRTMAPLSEKKGEGQPAMEVQP